MIEIQRILCPIDFSDHSRRALDHAMAIARWYKSTVTVLHVFSPAPLAGFGPASALRAGCPDTCRFRAVACRHKGICRDGARTRCRDCGRGSRRPHGRRNPGTGDRHGGRSARHRHAWAIRARTPSSRVGRRKGASQSPLSRDDRPDTELRTPCRQARSSIAGFSVQWTSPTRHRTHWRMRFRWRRKPTGS